MALRRPKASQSTQKNPEDPPPDPVTAHPNETSQKSAIKGDGNTTELSTAAFALLLTSVFVSMFLVALDRTIVSTAIPQITDEFNSLPDVGWYGSAYLLTCCSFQLLCGKLYTFYSVKITYIASVLLFEVGSALCGAAPSSPAFIVGRAIAGIGAAGIFAGSIVTIVYAVPLEKRPKFMGFFGAVFGITAIVGPLIGGAFTSNVTWRWCFYINLPFGGIAMVVIATFLNVPNRETTKLPWKAKLSQLDALGTLALIPGVVCLLLALQWGGQIYAWSNGRIIALLTLMGVLLPAFVAVQIFLPKTATIPPRIFKSRSVVGAFWSTILVGATQYIYIYFLPVWFQSINGVSAVQSGVRLLPLMLAMVVASVFGGFAIQKVGYYTPFAIVGACIMSIGAGLLTMLEVDSSSGKWIGYQIPYGFGMGLCFQAPNLAVQTVLPIKDVPIGSSLMFFAQLLGAAVFVSVGENVLDTQLIQRLSGIPGFQTSLVTSGGAIELISSLPDQRATILIAYNESLRKVFQIGLILACLSVPGVALLEWRNMLKKPEAKGGDVEAGQTDTEKKANGENLGDDEAVPEEKAEGSDNALSKSEKSNTANSAVP